MPFLNRVAEKCSGCLACELSCSLRHFGYFDSAKSRIRILHEEELSDIEIRQCSQCEERSCVKACPSGALWVDPTYGYVAHDEGACTKCRRCLHACRHHGVFWDEERNYPLICDLCEGDPECLKPCRLHLALTRFQSEEVRS